MTAQQFYKSRKTTLVNVPRVALFAILLLFVGCAKPTAKPDGYRRQWVVEIYSVSQNLSHGMAYEHHFFADATESVSIEVLGQKPLGKKYLVTVEETQ